MVTIYGIKNCDTMKKAMQWLTDHGVEFQFHDVRKDGLTDNTLLAWEKELGWEMLLNTRGMLWRKVDQATRDNIHRDSAIALMRDNPGIIKRPVLDLGNKRIVGFSADGYATLFS
ncbi:MAG: ArsC family reductase [Gammaproteobacteria bacterium]|nr:ArsC family reductase [Gammaproteobacteria bacterium]